LIDSFSGLKLEAWQLGIAETQSIICHGVDKNDVQHSSGKQKAANRFSSDGNSYPLQRLFKFRSPFFPVLSVGKLTAAGRHKLEVSHPLQLLWPLPVYAEVSFSL